MFFLFCTVQFNQVQSHNMLHLQHPLLLKKLERSFTYTLYVLNTMKNTTLAVTMFTIITISNT